MPSKNSITLGCCRAGSANRSSAAPDRQHADTWSMRRWPRGTAQAFVPLYADARFKRMMGSMGGRLKGQLTRLYRSCEKGDKQDSGVPARCFDSPTGWSQGGKTRTCASTGWIKPGNQACTNTSPKRCALRPPAGDTVASSGRQLQRARRRRRGAAVPR